MRYHYFLRFFVVFWAAAVLFSCSKTVQSEPEQMPYPIDSAFVQAMLPERIPFNRGECGLEGGIGYVDSVYKSVKSPGIREAFLRYEAIAFFYHRSFLYAEAIIYNDSVIQVISNAKAIKYFPTTYANAYFAIGDAYFSLGDFIKAYHSYFKGRKEIEGYSNNCALSEYNYRIAMSLYREGNYRKAAAYFRGCATQTAECKTDFKYVYRIQELMNNIGLCYAKSGELDSALMYYDSAVVVIRKIEASHPKEFDADIPIGVVYGNMGKAYTTAGNLEKAEEFLKRNIQLNMHPGKDIHDAHFSLLALSRLYIRQNKLAQAGDLLNAAKNSLVKYDFADVKNEWRLTMADYLSKTGKDREAYDLLSRYVGEKDAVVRKNSLNKEADIQQQFALLEHLEENKSLKEDVRQKRIMLLYLFGAVLLVVLILLGVVFIYKRTREFVKRLTELNTTIELQKAELEQRNKDKDQIMRIVAHDLRNPIWGINALSKMVLDDMEPTDKLHESVALINNSSDSTIVLINELLEATMGIEEAMEKKPEDIFEVVTNIVQILRPRAAEKGQQIVWEDDNEKVFNFNAEKVSRVLSNLIFNAIKFSPRGSSIDVRVKMNEQDVIVEVKDYGVGVPEHLQAKIFEMFTTAKRQGTEGEKSYGLGLAICRIITEAHGGRLWLESKENEGTTFFMLLPTV